jgi:uncharacterized protein
MSLATGTAALDLVERENGSLPCGIVFFGGEPLLCKDLLVALVTEGQRRRAAQRCRFHYKVTTNGLGLDEAFLSWADEVGLLVALSLDGTQQAHDAHRRMPDGGPSFERVLPKLDLLLGYQPHATVFATVNPDTAPLLAESVRFLVEQGVRYVVTSVNFLTDWTTDDLAALVGQYERLADLYLAWSRAGRKFYLSPFEMCIATHLAGPEAASFRCDLGTKQISVDPEGWLYPCVEFVHAGPSWRIGHVASGVDVDAREALRRATAAPMKVCRECALEPRCPRTCGCLNHRATGVLGEVPPLLCHHQQALTPIADKVAATLWSERNPLFLQKHYNRAWPLLSLLDDHLRGVGGLEEK